MSNISPIISQEPFIPHEFMTLDPSDRDMMSTSEYESYVAWFNQCYDVYFERIVYCSDGLRIVGIISRPKNLTINHRYPVIIYNRGGTGESGKVTVRTLYKHIHPLVQLGYIVIASQYRGNDGSDGHDEIGGADIDDVLALYPVIQLLPYADDNSIFMVGMSRGAIDTYRVLQKNLLPIRACAVMSGLSDLFSFVTLRPDLLPMLLQFVPTYLLNKSAELTKRSAICWVQDISVPLLLLHGDADEMVDVQTTYHFAEQLAQHHKIYDLIIYKGADHSLDAYHDQVIAAIDNWFTWYKN